jgi:hypothetical protein
MAVTPKFKIEWTEEDNKDGVGAGKQRTFEAGARQIAREGPLQDSLPDSRSRPLPAPRHGPLPGIGLTSPSAADPHELFARAPPVSGGLVQDLRRDMRIVRSHRRIDAASPR